MCRRQAGVFLPLYEAHLFRNIQQYVFPPSCNIQCFPFLSAHYPPRYEGDSFQAFPCCSIPKECFHRLARDKKCCSYIPRYGKRLIFRAMQAMQFIRVYEHTEKTLFIRSALRSFMRIKKPRPPRGDCGFLF